jgi:hypothetical protein
MGSTARARSIAAATMLCALSGVQAQSVTDATTQSVTQSPASVVPPTAWRPPRPASWQEMRVVELPAEPNVGAPRRKHHALTWHNDTLSRSLGNAGLAQADCHNRVRLPSRLRASPGVAGPAVEVQLQFAIGCSF